MMTTTTMTIATAMSDSKNNCARNYNCERELVCTLRTLGYKTPEEMRMYLSNFFAEACCLDWHKPSKLTAYAVKCAVTCDRTMLTKVYAKYGKNYLAADVMWFIMSHIALHHKALHRELVRDALCIHAGCYPTYAAGNTARVLAVALDMVASMETYLTW